MFGKPPRFPIATSEKVSVERSLDWLLASLDYETVPRIQPLTRHSPAVKNCLAPGGESGGILPKAVLELVKQQLPFDSADFRLQIVEPEHDTMVANLSPLHNRDPNVLLIRSEEVHDLDMLIGRISCLLSFRYYSDLFAKSNPSEFQVICEYLPTIFGLGVFCANSSLVSSNVTTGQEHMWAQWKFREIPARFFGVAMACLAYRNGVSTSLFEKELRPDARVPMKRAMKYYQKTGDCLLAPESRVPVFRNDNNPQLIDLLGVVSDSATYAVVDQLRCNIQGYKDSQALQKMGQWLPRLLSHKDACVRQLVARFCLEFDEIDDDTIDGLKALLCDRDSLIRESALQALIQMAAPDRVSLVDIRASLGDHDLNVADWAAMGVMQLGEQDERVAHDVLPTIRRAINNGQWETAVHLCEALEVLSDDWQTKLNDFFADSPHQLIELKHGLREWKQVAEDAGPQE